MTETKHKPNRGKQREGGEGVKSHQPQGTAMAGKKKTAKSAKPVIVHGFKGFTKDLKCRDKQYALGETYEEAEASLCHHGLHFCEYPLDCLGYYEPGLGSRYAEVIAENPLDERDNDSKRVTKKLSIGGELSFRGLIEAAVKFTFDRAIWSDSDKATGDYGAAYATGGKGAASATGEDSVAMASGQNGKAKACLGSWIVLAERDRNWKIQGMRCAVIDGEILKPDTYYTLQNGEFVKAE